jgi:hypothetical protein
MNLRSFVLGALCVSLVVCGVSVLLGADEDVGQSKAALENRLQELLKERVTTAERAVDATQAAFGAQTITLDVLLDCVNKLADAELAVAGTDAEKFAALEKRVALLLATEEKIQVLFNVGGRGGEAKEYAMAQRERQSAEIALIQARLKAKAEKKD